MADFLVRSYRGGIPDSVHRVSAVVCHPDGTLVASGDNGITVLYERVFDTVKDPTGTPISGPQWVWRVLGDSGENVTDLAFQPVPEPGALWLLAAGLVGLARWRRRR